jgi:predicted ATPase
MVMADATADVVDPETGARRYRLPEIAREYAVLKLGEAGELDAVQARHARAVADRMEAARKAYWHTADAPWLAAYGPEIDNLRSALDWAVRHDPPIAVESSCCSAWRPKGASAGARCAAPSTTASPRRSPHATGWRAPATTGASRGHR